MHRSCRLGRGARAPSSRRAPGSPLAHRVRGRRRRRARGSGGSRERQRASQTAKVSAAFSFQETLRIALHGVFEARIDGPAEPLERAPPECLGPFVIFGLRDRNFARALVLAVRTLFTGPPLVSFARRLLLALFAAIGRARHLE